LHKECGYDAEAIVNTAKLLMADKVTISMIAG
jgi:hypothetical protein